MAGMGGGENPRPIPHFTGETKPAAANTSKAVLPGKRHLQQARPS